MALKHWYCFFCFIGMGFLFPIISQADVSLKPSGFVNDYAGILSAEEKERLETLANEIEKRTTAEVAVVIIKSLDGQNLEDYANEIFNTWGIGKKGKDNGVLILVSLEERKIRIEVGYGLEEFLTDGRCGAIIREILVPYFRRQDYAGGLSSALSTIEGFISGKTEREALPVWEKRHRPPIGFIALWQSFCLIFGWAILGLAGLTVIGILIVGLDISAVITLSLNHSSGEWLLLLGLFVPFLTIFLMAPVAGLLHERWRKKLKKVYGSRWKDHWPIWLGNPSWSSSGGGFGSGGGGFGGGSSGGGGASGGW
ncbi:MAG: TPM domain-containing protein [Candidatus Omnitrophica bacterium]|nr:TPM domain-containing protein [Candidatus Omnitrophota bacterium]